MKKAKRISELPIVENISIDAIVPAAQDSVTYGISIGKIRDALSQGFRFVTLTGEYYSDSAAYQAIYRGLHSYGDKILVHYYDLEEGIETNAILFDYTSEGLQPTEQGKYVLLSDSGLYIYDPQDRRFIKPLNRIVTEQEIEGINVEEIKAAVDGINQYDDRIAEAEAEAERLVRDLAQYEAEEAISLVVGTSGKVVNTAGALVARSGFAVSQPVRLRKGYTYLYRPLNGQPLPEGVALCARLVTTDTPVVIDYVYEYDAMARPIVATAQHSGERYTIEYDAQGQAVTYDSEGTMVQGLPQYRIAQANTYVPMFVSLSQTMPKSGYYAVLCNEDCMAVWSAALAGGVLGSVEVTSYGFVRSLVNQKEDKAVVKQLQERVGEMGAVVSRLEAAEFAALPMELEHTTYDMQILSAQRVTNTGSIITDANYNVAALRLEAGVHYIDYIVKGQYATTITTMTCVADCEDIAARLASGSQVDGVLVSTPSWASNSVLSGLLRIELYSPCWLVCTGYRMTTPPRFDVYRLAEARPSMNAATRLADECSLAAAAVPLQNGQALVKIRRGREYHDVKASAAHDTWAVVPYVAGASAASPDVLAIASVKLSSWGNSAFATLTNCEYLDLRGLSGQPVSMNNTFADLYSLRELDITGIDTSRVTNMNNLFSGDINLRRIYGIEGLDTSLVTALSSTFANCHSLETLDLSGWDVSNVTTMNNMFGQCYGLRHLSVDGWDVGNVTTIKQMLSGCTSLQEMDLSSWTLGAVTDISSMFSSDTALRRVRLFSMPNATLTNGDGVFYGCAALEEIEGINDWNMEAVTDIGSMFSGCHVIKSLDLSNWHTPNLTDCSLMFNGCWELETIALSQFDTTNVTNISNMSKGCNKLHFLRVGENFFRTRQTIDLSQCPLLGREGSTTNSNGWLEHFAATAPQITDGQARTIKLHSAIRSYEWAIPYISTLTSKGYTIA